VPTTEPADVLEEIRSLKASGAAFAIATIVRTASLAAPRPGGEPSPPALVSPSGIGDAPLVLAAKKARV